MANASMVDIYYIIFSFINCPQKTLKLLVWLQVAWEHEQFSRSRVTAVTLSELSSAPELLESTGGLSDNRWVF